MFKRSLISEDELLEDYFHSFGTSARYEFDLNEKIDFQDVNMYLQKLIGQKLEDYKTFLDNIGKRNSFKLDGNINIIVSFPPEGVSEVLFVENLTSNINIDTTFYNALKGGGYDKVEIVKKGQYGNKYSGVLARVNNNLTVYQIMKIVKEKESQDYYFGSKELLI